MALAQGGHLAWVVHDEGGLYQLLLAVLAEDGIDQLALAHGVVDLDFEAFAGFAELLFALPRDVVAGLFADGVCHRQAAERGFERNLPAVDLHGRGPVQGQGDLFEHPFGELHHPEVVLVGYVNLHNGKFGVVRAVHAFVAEVLAEFIHAVEASYDQLLEVQLAGDAQVLVDVERVVVGNERTCRRTARNRLQNRGFDFDVPELVEIFAHRGDDLRTLDENLAYVGIHDQIDVALAVTDFGVGEGVEGLSVLLFHDGQGPQRFGEQGQLLAVYRQFAGVGAECETLDSDDVADVEQLLEHRVVKRRISFGTDVVAPDIDLDAARVVLQFEEGGAAHDAARHDASGDADALEIILRRIEILGDFACRGRHLVAGGGIGVDAEFPQCGERLAS